jgi:hypothetical protein
MLFGNPSLRLVAQCSTREHLLIGFPLVRSRIWGRVPVGGGGVGEEDDNGGEPMEEHSRSDVWWHNGETGAPARPQTGEERGGGLPRGGCGR